jgi:hypothetical protein
MKLAKRQCQGFSYQGIPIPYSSPVNSLFRFARKTKFSAKPPYNLGTYPRGSLVNERNSLYFSLLSGNSGGERFAGDCVHRHAVGKYPDSRENRPKMRVFGPILAEEGAGQMVLPSSLSKAMRRCGIAFF